MIIEKDIKIKGVEVLVLGITFKENCPDVRGTKVVDVVNGLREYGSEVIISDPWTDEEDVFSEYKLVSIKQISVCRS